MKSGTGDEIKAERDISSEPEPEPEADSATAATQLNTEDNMETDSKKSQYGHNRRVKYGMWFTVIHCFPASLFMA